MMSKAVIGKGGETKSEKRRAPTTKSSWSTIGNGAPGERFNRLLIKDSSRSPNNAPSEVVNPSSRGYLKRGIEENSPITF